MKKLNKFFAVLVALAMMATLCVSMAFAAPTHQTDDNIAYGLPADAVLTKYLQIPSGETLPDDQEFTFTFTKVSDSSHEGTDCLPDAATAKIKVKDMTKSGSTTDGNGLVYSINIANLFKYTEEEAANKDGVDAGDYKFPHAGEFVYTVKEAEGTTTKTDWTFDSQTYTLKIIVKNDAVSGKPVISTITVAKGTENNAEKVDPTVQDPTTVNQIEETWDQLTNATAEGFTFVNKYEPEGKTIDPKPDDPTTGKYGALGVTKSVDANGSKQAEFPFTIKLNAPADYHGDLNVDALIITGTDKEHATKVSVPFGGNGYDFNLKDGQSLAFERLPDGTTYEVKERLTATTSITDWGNYTPSVTVLDDGETVTGLAAGQKGTDYAPITAANALKVEKADTKTNVAAFTNTREDISPTGILISNLPYIALALVAIGGLVAYVVVRRRQDDEA